MMRGQIGDNSNEHEDQQSRIFYELSSLVLTLLKSPWVPLTFSNDTATTTTSSAASTRRRRRSVVPAEITPTGFASLLMGVSVALMVCGSVTFFIGFLLMPWVIGLFMLFYFVGIVSSISMLGRALFCPPSSSSLPKDISSWKLL